MKNSNRLMPIIIGGVLLAGVGIIASKWFLPMEKTVTTVDVTVPPLSEMATEGRATYDASCAGCHGRNGAGTNKGPPLVHDIYNPGHHSDAAFFRAAKQGVRQHHWPYGNMPPRPEVSDKQLTAIVRYIRELQEANGISYRPHRM